MKLNEVRILTEHCVKEEKYFRVYDHYTPNYYKSIVTGKFYSKYDALDLSKADEDLVQQVKIHRDKGPKGKFSWPATENQIYGWFNTPLVDLDRNDERLYFPQTQSVITKHGLLLRKDRSMKIEKFTGIPFKLQ